MSLRQLRTAAFAGARCFGINACLRQLLRRRLMVLCYHSIIPDDFPDDPYRTRGATRVSEFRRQLATVGRFFRPVSAAEVLNHVTHGERLLNYSVLVTFDDGFRNNLTWAAPEMERLGIPALIHVTTGHIGQKTLLWPQEVDNHILSWHDGTLPMPQGQEDIEMPDHWSARWQIAEKVRGICKRLSHEERLAYLDRLRDGIVSPPNDGYQDLHAFLSWEEVRQLDRRGFAIGCHTVTHPILTTLSASDLERELTESKAHIESELGRPCPWIAYPNGGSADFSPEVLAATEEAGYKLGFTLLNQPNPETLEPLAVNRINIPGNLSEDAFQAHINGLLTVLQR